jgi:transcription elongation factor Elf1
MSTATLEKTFEFSELKEAFRDKPELDARFRCDRCGAQAYVRTTLESENSLYWCGHHAKMFIPIMDGQGVLRKVYSEEVRLKEDRKTGSEN